MIYHNGKLSFLLSSSGNKHHQRALVKFLVSYAMDFENTLSRQLVLTFNVVVNAIE